MSNDKDHNKPHEQPLARQSEATLATSERNSAFTMIRNFVKRPVIKVALFIITIKPILKGMYDFIDAYGNMQTAVDILKFLNTGWGTLTLMAIGFGLIVWQLLRQQKRLQPDREAADSPNMTQSMTGVKEPCPDKRVHVVADTQAKHIDHYVILTKIATGDQKLTADVPSIIFGLEVRNESVFDISIDMDVENSHVFFGEQLLAERKILLSRSENIPPRSTGTLTFEQRLSSTEAALISKFQSEANTKLRFDRLNIIITGGTDCPQVARKYLEIPKDIEVNEALPKDLKARIAFLQSELAESEGHAETITRLREEQQSVESQLSRRARVVRALSEVVGYGKAIEDKCQPSNMEYPKHEIDEWARHLWTALRWSFEEDAIEKFYLGLDPRCPGYEYGVLKIIEVPEPNAERHLWFSYHLLRLTALINEQLREKVNPLPKS
jgi:hypothetical protein